MQRLVEKTGMNVSVGILPVSGTGLVVERDGRRIIDGVDVSIECAGGGVALLGPNGAGKSVLIRVLAGLLQPDRGTVNWAGNAPSPASAGQIGFVFQRPVMLRRTAAANISFALGVTGVPAGERSDRAYAALTKAGLAHLGDTPAHVLSGGEQQRLALARALACEPCLYILDEPTANLDPASTAAIEIVLQEIRATGTPILFISHDLGQARRLADDVIFLHHGRIRERTPASQFFAEPKSREAKQFIKGEIVL